MKEMGLVAAIRKTILEGVAVGQLKKEYTELTDKDKKELADLFNKEKTFGPDVEVVTKLS